MRNFLFVLLFLAVPFTTFADGPLTSIGGVMCGVSTEPGVKAVPVGSTTYIFRVNSSEIVSEVLDLDLQLEYTLCAKLNNQYSWIRLNKLPGLYVSTQRVYESGNKWKAKGFWDTAIINDTETKGLYNVRFDSIELKKLLTREEYAAWKSGKTFDVHLKLELASEKYAYIVGGYMVLKLTLLPNNGIEVVNIL